MGAQSEASPSIRVTKRTDCSFLMALLQFLVRPFGTVLIRPFKTYPAIPQLKPHRFARRRCNITERQIEGLYIYDMTPNHVPTATPKPDTRRRIYYFPGGGWQMPASPQHWKLCAKLATDLPNTTISIVSYPLAPKAPAQIALPKLLRWYRAALTVAAEAGETVTLAGDSAGGNIVLALTILALTQDPDAPAPAALLAISPTADLRTTNPEQRAVEKFDPVLDLKFLDGTASAWAGELDKADPRVSPLQADVGVLARRDVRVHGVTGGYDVLTPDALLFRERCKSEGVRGEWLEWEKQMHCFPLTWCYGLREGREGVVWIEDVLGKEG